MALWDSWFAKERPLPAAVAKGLPPEFPYPLVAVPGARALAEWQRLREAWRAEGACPVLLGDREEVERARETMETDADSPKEILRVAAQRTPEAFLAERLKEHREIFEEADRDTGEPPPVEHDGLFVALGTWPASPSPHALGAHADILTGKPKATVYFARIPTPRSYEAFAYLGYGAWNECPAAEDHVALHRRWHERHGAEVYAVAGDVVECWVPLPPEDRDGAAAVAREQYLYCPDIVDQGTNTLLNLAGALKGSSAWFFWWD